MQAFKTRLALYAIHVDSGEPVYRKVGRAGTRQQIIKAAAAMGLRWKADPGSLFGGYYVGAGGMAYKIDIAAVKG